MNQQSKGSVRAETVRTVSEEKLDELATALDTDTAAGTAHVLAFFGVTLAGEGAVLDVLQGDPSRALMVGQACQWNRPFRSGEQVRAKVYVEDVYQRGDNEFAVVVSEFRDSLGVLIQSQRTTFIEMARPAGAPSRGR